MLKTEEGTTWMVFAVTSGKGYKLGRCENCNKWSEKNLDEFCNKILLFRINALKAIKSAYKLGGVGYVDRKCCNMWEISLWLGGAGN